MFYKRKGAGDTGQNLKHIKDVLHDREFRIKSLFFLRYFEVMHITDRTEKEKFIIANKDRPLKELALYYAKELKHLPY